MSGVHWNIAVELTEIPKNGATYQMDATETDRLNVAKRISVPEILRLRGSVTITPTGSGASVQGKINAEIKRICVASLEPFIEKIAEDFDVIFSRENKINDPDVDFIFSDSDPEPLEDDKIEPAELLIQQLALSMAPYPKSTSARNLTEEFGKIGNSSPFSVLKDLKK